MVTVRLARLAAVRQPWSAFLGPTPLLIGFCLAPALFVDIPPLVDYPNHLTRMFLLAGEGVPNPFYHPHWALYPNLAMDLIVPALARFMPVVEATRLFFLASELLVVSGAIVLERTVKGRTELAPLAAAFFLYTLPFAWGFVNFEFGFGLALWAIALWFATGPGWTWRRGALHALACAALFTAHLFALGLYGVAIGLHEAWRLWTHRLGLRAAFASALWLGWPALALLGLMRLTGGAVGGGGTAWLFTTKPYWLLHLVSGHHLWLSAAAVTILLALLARAARAGALGFHRSGGFMLAGFVLLYLLMPFQLFDTAFVDVRVLSAAAFILPAFVAVRAGSKEWRTAARVVAALALVNSAVVWRDFLNYRDDYREMIGSFSRLERGAKLLVAHSGAASDPPADLLEYPMYHAPTLAAAYAGAFVPTVFTYPGKQPLVVDPSVQRLDIPQGGPVPIAYLDAVVAGAAPDPPTYIQSWWADFDYVYVLGPARAWRSRAHLEEVSRGRRFVLYRVARTTPPTMPQSEP